jgi:hypothetical protein
MRRRLLMTLALLLAAALPGVAQAPLVYRLGVTGVVENAWRSRPWRAARRRPRARAVFLDIDTGGRTTLPSGSWTHRGVARLSA